MEVEADESRRRAARVPRRAAEQAPNGPGQPERTMQLRPVSKLLLRRDDFGGEPFGAGNELAPVCRAENDRRIGNGRNILDLRIPLAALEDRPAADDRRHCIGKRIDRAERGRGDQRHAGPRRMT